MEILYAIVRFFQSGGVFMYPILFIFAIGLAIAVERYVYLTIVRIRNRGDWKAACTTMRGSLPSVRTPP